MDFLRQLAYENANLTETFTKFYENVPDSGDESSDDDSDFIASQSTSSSQQTMSQNEMDVSDAATSVPSQQSIDSNMDVINESAEFSFEISNENQSNIDESMHADDISAESSFENTNENQPIVHSSIRVDALPAHKLPPNIIIPDGLLLRGFKIIPPSVRKEIEKAREEEKRAENERQNKLRMDMLAKLAAEVPEPANGDCKICSEKQCDTYCLPCSHACCSKCWQGHLEAHKKKCEKTDWTIHVIRRKIKEPPCMFCRQVVQSTMPLFL